MGEPVDSREIDPYSVLGVHRRASRDDIRRAYLRLARRSHPDVRGGEPVAAERMRRINRAWELLSDPEARAAFDLSGQDISSDSPSGGSVWSGVRAGSRGDEAARQVWPEPESGSDAASVVVMPPM